MANLLMMKPRGFENFYPKSERETDSKVEDEKDPKKHKNDGGGPKPFFGLQKFFVTMAIGSLFFLSLYGGFSGKEINFQEFLSNYLSKGYVEKLEVINKEFCRVVLREDAKSFLTKNNVQNPERLIFRLGSIDALDQRLEKFQENLGIHPKDYIPIQYVQEFSFLSEVRSILPSILIFVFFILLMQRLQGKGAGGQVDKFFKMGKANPVNMKDMKSKLKFSDVAGMKEAKKEITEFVDFLKNSKKYEQLGAKIPKGALLCGPPGTGKTLLAKAVAGEANVPFFSMSGSDFIEVFVGVGPSRVRDLFSQARKHAPSIVFIDEIDAVGRKRARGGFSGGANDERENTLNQLLVEMDGFTTSTGVIVLAGTNRSDILDPALTRPGRFDRTVTIEKPDLEERQDIFKVHLKPIKLSKNMDFEQTTKRMSALTPGFAGADIANVCNEAAILAARRGNIEGVDEEDFERAAERVMGGLPKSHSLMTQKQKKIVAYHEAGHALAGWLLENADPVLKVSIVPRSNGALGFSQQMPDDVMLFSRESLLDRMAVVLGGRAAEEMFIGSISTGASDDLDKLTKMAYAFVTQWGMNQKVGLISFQSNNKDDAQFYKPFSDKTAELIDSEVKMLIETQYERVKNLFDENREKIEKLAELLFLKETISFNDIVNCIGPRPFPMHSKFKDYAAASPTIISISDVDNTTKKIDILDETEISDLNKKELDDTSHNSTSNTNK